MTVFNDKFTMKVMLADVVYILLFHFNIERKNHNFLAARHMFGG